MDIMVAAHLQTRILDGITDKYLQVEMAVPYGDPVDPYHRKCAFDVGGECLAREVYQQTRTAGLLPCNSRSPLLFHGH